MVRETRIALTLICCMITGPLLADDRGETLEQLLSDLRKLHEVRRQEDVQSREEFRHLKRLISEKESELAHLTDTKSTLTNHLKDETRRADEAKAKLSALQKQAAALRTSLRSIAVSLQSAGQTNPLLLDTTETNQLSGILDDGDTLPLHDLTSRCISVLLSVSSRVTSCETGTRTIKLADKKELHVNTLRLGSLAVVWLTPDGNRCGIGTSSKGTVNWQQLPESDLPAIISAFAVANEDTPADVTVLPLPAGGAQ